VQFGIPSEVDTQTGCNALVGWRVPAGFQRVHDAQNSWFQPLVMSPYAHEARAMAGTEYGRCEDRMPRLESLRGNPYGSG